MPPPCSQSSHSQASPPLRWFPMPRCRRRYPIRGLPQIPRSRPPCPTRMSRPPQSFRSPDRMIRPAPILSPARSSSVARSRTGCGHDELSQLGGPLLSQQVVSTRQLDQ